MGERVEGSNLSVTAKPNNAISEKKTYKKPLVSSRPKDFEHRNTEHLLSLTRDGFGSSPVGRLTFFLIKVAALEAVRRVSKSRCPCVWRGLQGLQILVYPPFKWIQRWSPFKGLVRSMQVLSRPLLVLSIATVFTDESQCSDGTPEYITDPHDSEASADLSSVPANSSIGHSESDPEVLEYEKWLIQLKQELEIQGISLPERIDDDELHRFYSACNNDVSSFFTAIKKTIQWRGSYKILSEEELESWSSLVFWHGFDVMQRPCLIVRLGLACRSLVSRDRPQFAQAVISQVEYGVLHLVSAHNPQITVLVDCEGLSPLRIPMKTLRSCSSLLQDHFPNRLGGLFVIRLPSVVRVIAQTFISVLKSTTRKKLKIGEIHQKFLRDNLPTLPAYLGGSCTCIVCCRIGKRNVLQPGATGTSSIHREINISDNEDSSSLHSSSNSDLDEQQNNKYDQLLKTAIISILVFWVLVAISAGIYTPENRLV
ncbi:hypothetical protein HN51_010064 [Arachis hypogaea]|nr:phosphatidylinositol/phosphatidylcholine transfer protein SFH10 [Arachis duranensis]XP_025686154.1 phosphatidylinositol/phosphatidylcholine transfer protein SFH10 [Arachis hypogaea]XP_025686155.1 phosphatidylinositol/phosphatidylcholine transfer protein SFH10 [Arachis hypogaea]QHO55067.1 Sec14 cytosolic factor [Arachis hypogaea]